MRNIIAIVLLLFVGIQMQAQVGVNTKNPQATLDINGTLRVQTRSMVNGEVKKLLGVDEQGVIIEVELDENLYIEDNVVKYNGRKESVYSMPAFAANDAANLAGIIWPGGAGNGKSVVRIENLFNDLEITGIDVSLFPTPMDAHGYTISLYNISGELNLKSEDNTSLNENQFILSDGNDVNIKQYEMIKLMYDGILQKWIVMSKH